MTAHLHLQQEEGEASLFMSLGALKVLVAGATLPGQNLHDT